MGYFSCSPSIVIDKGLMNTHVYLGVTDSSLSIHKTSTLEPQKSTYLSMEMAIKVKTEAQMLSMAMNWDTLQ